MQRVCTLCILLLLQVNNNNMESIEVLGPISLSEALSEMFSKEEVEISYGDFIQNYVN